MSHISFSELKIWNECPFKHKLVHIDKIKAFIGNEYTAFGTALHTVCEEALESEYGRNVALSEEEMRVIFKTNFLRIIDNLRGKGVNIDSNMASSMLRQAKTLIPDIMPSLKEYFGEFELFTTEEGLMEEILDYDKANINFKGFIDLVLKTKDGKYHIIDWKTCTWGWDAKRRSEPMTTYQLTYYKYYFSAKHNIDPKNIDTHFALLKRTAKKDQVEIFRITSGPIKTKNALNLLTKALHNISRKKYVKNRLSCTYCEFKKTAHCP